MEKLKKLNFKATFNIMPLFQPHVKKINLFKNLAVSGQYPILFLNKTSSI